MLTVSFDDPSQGKQNNIRIFKGIDQVTLLCAFSIKEATQHCNIH